MQSNDPIRIGLNIIKIIEAALTVDNLDDLLEVTLSQLLHVQHVRQANIHLFNKKNRLVLAASAQNAGLKGNDQQKIRVQSWNIDSSRRHSIRRSSARAPFLEYTIPLIQSSSLLGFLNVQLDQIPMAANDLKANLYLVGLQLSTKIQELRLHEDIGNAQSELRNAVADNRQNQQRLTSLSKELYTICAISTKINQSMDLKKSLRKSMLKIKEVFRASGVMVYLKAPKGYSTQLKVVRIGEKQLNTQMLERFAKTVEQEFNASRSALKDGLHHRFSHPKQVSLDKGRNESIVAVPMTFKKKFVGTLILVLEPLSSFHQDNLRLLSGVANIMAMAIENMRLYRESQQKKKEAAFLVNSILKFNQNLDLELTLKSIAEKGGEFFGRQCRVYLLSETKIPMIQHNRHNKKALNSAQTEAFKRIRPQALYHFYKKMMHQKRSSLIGDIGRSRRMKGSLKVYFKEESIHSVIAVPLKLAYRPMGLLLLGSTAGRQTLDRHELAMVEALGAAAAVAIENVWAYDASVEMSAFLEKKIGEKTTQIQQIQERQKVRVENRKDIIFRVSKNNRFVFVNKAMENLTGCSREELYREDIGADEVVATEDRERVRNGFRKIIKRELPIVKDLEYRHLNRKGEDHLVSLTIYPEKDQFGRIIGVEGVGRDITEKKRLEAELEKTKDLALLGEFSSAIAHQIRNPLSNILMGTKLLKRAVGLDVCDSVNQAQTLKRMASFSVSRENLSDIFRNLSDGIYNLNQVVTELVEYTKTLKPRLTSQAIDTILNETLTSLEDMITQNGICVKKYFEAALPSISVDAVLIGQVFRNLIHNATQAMKAGGYLFVTAGIYRQKPNWAIISIGDTGIGIESGEFERIFHPFYTTKESGTGLGLSLAHRIVEAHGGKIWACPNPCPHQIFENPGNMPVFRPPRQGLTFHILLAMDN
jgi:PAS domain S-box-containing protein